MENQTLEQALQIVKEQYINDINRGVYNGLCDTSDIAFNADLISEDNFDEITTLLEERAQEITLYWKLGEERSENKVMSFYWAHKDSKSRIDWLEKHIKLNK